MRVYLAAKYHADGRNRPLVEAILEGLEAAGHKTIFVQRDLERWGEVVLLPTELMRQSLSLIATCDLVLVELSEKGVGVGLEAGYAYALGKPIVTIARTGADVSETLWGISSCAVHYHKLQDLKKLFGSLERFTR